uniref:Aminopeptidase NAALADL1 n=1 Tax=Rhipicephalus appendiculatus TaxID=34631 RepID=A0A131YJE0_RHIAP
MSRNEALRYRMDSLGSSGDDADEGVGAMADYIRGKKTYTKWDADTDNVDMDLSPEAPHVQVATSPGWFSGTKGRVLRVLIVGVIFLVGLMCGYVARKSMRDMGQPPQSSCPMPRGIYSFKERFAEQLLTGVDKQNLDSWLRVMSVHYHMAGTERGQQLAMRIEQAWKGYGVDNTRTEVFKPLLSFPDKEHPNEVRIMRGNNILFNTSETGPEAAMAVKPFSAYSPSGIVRGKPVYAHYGTEADFALLRSKNIVLNNTIAIIRYGKIHRGYKVKLAEENGVAGVLLYSDPFDSPTDRANPSGGMKLQGDGVERGNLKSYPGDPGTPYLPATDDVYMPPRSDRKSLDLPSIPVQPVSYNDARQLLNNMSGSMAPVEWQGRLNITYNLGPGYSTGDEVQVELAVHNILQRSNIQNVIGVMMGNFEPGRYIIVGCHHDSWTKGAGDPGTGMAALMELVRLFGSLRKNGWTPGRTLVFASWDAEEFGMVGSNEWVQAHEQELYHRTVAYINLDQAVSGNSSLYALASPLLRQALKEAAELVPCHEGAHTEMSVYDMWRMRKPRVPNNSHAPPLIMPPASGSDFASFLLSLGVASAHLQFVGKDPASDYPPYHTAYDTYEMVVNQTDPGLRSLASLVRVVGVLLLKLVDSLQLPMHAADYAEQIRLDYVVFEKTYSQLLKDHNIDLEPLSKSLIQFEQAALNFHDNYEEMNKNNLLLALQEYNDRLMQLERAFLLPAAYPHHPHYRHVIYGPDVDSGYRSVLFPHLTAAISNARQDNHSPSWNRVRECLSYVVNALRSATNVLSSAVVSWRTAEL